MVDILLETVLDTYLLSINLSDCGRYFELFQLSWSRIKISNIILLWRHSESCSFVGPACVWFIFLVPWSGLDGMEVLVMKIITNTLTLNIKRSSRWELSRMDRHVLIWRVGIFCVLLGQYINVILAWDNYMRDIPQNICVEAAIRLDVVRAPGRFGDKLIIKQTSSGF